MRDMRQTDGSVSVTYNTLIRKRGMFCLCLNSIGTAKNLQMLYLGTEMIGVYHLSRHVL